VSGPAEPRLLILETSGRSGFVAAAEGGALRGVRPLEEARRHARDLAPAAAELLAGQGWAPQDVAAVLVSRGPGSYTGLRVGLMSAKAFAYATGCALIAVETFAAIARQAPPEAVSLDVLADAQQDRVYAQRYVRPAPGAGPAPATALRIEPLTAWLAQTEPPGWVTGPGLGPYRARVPDSIRVVEAERWHPQAESLLQIGLARYRAGERDDLWTAEPLYLRPSSAEEQWRK
jgi:tRNA threonylcarbamoyladenosine biosynthesis protein TsaB